MEANNLSSITNKRQKKAFTKEEDEAINYAVNEYGSKDWNKISTFIKGRTAKQCRDRYMNYLKPGISNIEWTDREDKLLLDLYFQLGPRWAIISSLFFNRNQISVKNRYKFLSKSRNLNEHLFNDTLKTLLSHKKHDTKKKTQPNLQIQQDDSSINLFNPSKNSLKTDIFDFDIYRLIEEEEDIFSPFYNLESNENFSML